MPAGVTTTATSISPAAATPMPAAPAPGAPASGAGGGAAAAGAGPASDPAGEAFLACKPGKQAPAQHRSSGGIKSMDCDPPTAMQQRPHGHACDVL